MNEDRKERIGALNEAFSQLTTEELMAYQSEADTYLDQEVTPSQQGQL